MIFSLIGTDVRRIKRKWHRENRNVFYRIFLLREIWQFDRGERERKMFSSIVVISTCTNVHVGIPVSGWNVSLAHSRNYCGIIADDCSPIEPISMTRCYGQINDRKMCTHTKTYYDKSIEVFRIILFLP